MVYQKLDIFAKHFCFNTGDKQMKRGTILSVTVIAISLMYFIQLIKQYSTNQIEPIVKSQNFISNDVIELNINNDLVGFRFESGDNSIEPRLVPVIRRKIMLKSKFNWILMFRFFQNTQQLEFVPRYQ
ncbi:hypothetical protein ABPG72_011359 [Tetrahymena utriculariae]